MAAFIFSRVGKRAGEQIITLRNAFKDRLGKSMGEAADSHLSNKLFFAKHKIAFLLICILTILVYWNSLHGQFYWDDGFLISNNDVIKELSLKNIKAYFIDKNAYPSAPGDIYRPLYLFSFALNYKTGGLNPVGYHLFNLLVHLANSILFFLLLIKLTNDIRLSLISALIFAVHPVHTESVSWVKGRDDLLSLLFLMSSILTYIRFCEKGRRFYYMISILSYILALLSKETSVMLLPLLFFFDFYRIKERLKISRYMPYLFITFMYIYIRNSVLGQFAETERWTGGVTETIYTMTKSLGYYVRLLLLPINLCNDYGPYPLTKNLDFGVILSFVAVSSLLWVALSGLKKRNIFGLAVIWFLMTLLPVLNIVPIKIGIAERYLYIPSIGFSILSGLMAAQLWSKKAISALFIVIFTLIFYSAGTVKRNQVWNNSYAMLRDTIDKSPSSSRTHYNMGNFYKDMKKWDMALHHWREAIKYDPGYSEAYNQIGNYLFLMETDYVLALKMYEKALSGDPNNAEAHYNVAITMENLGRASDALTYYKSFVRLAPERLMTTVQHARKRIYELESH